MFNKLVFIFLISSLALFSTESFATEKSDLYDPEEVLFPVMMPKGDPVAGQKAFKSLQCTMCHKVAGDNSLPAPNSDIQGPVLRNPKQESPVGWLLDSIVSPSHSVRVGAEGGPTLTAGSFMKDFSEEMTIRQLIDIIAYLKEEK